MTHVSLFQPLARQSWAWYQTPYWLFLMRGFTSSSAGVDARTFWQFHQDSDRRLICEEGGLMSRIVNIFVALVVLVPTARAQSWRLPAESERCPSRWGAGDERGSMNHQKPEAVLKAARLIRKGDVLELGRVLSSTMPLPSTRTFDLHTKRTFMNTQPNRRGSNEELVITELGQVGTQFDGFTHQTIGDSVYNCTKVDDIATRSGFSKLGIEKVGMVFTRGVLIDVAALKGVEMLAASYEITVNDLQQALTRQHQVLQPGDAILLNTGWGRLWEKDNDRYLGPSPGIGVAATEWLVKQDPLLIGGDTGPVEVMPNPDPQLNLPVHQMLLVQRGIHLLENLKLDDLSAQRLYEFAFVMQPLKIQGGTGSTVAPVAIR
jgi:kynurenine formamidase